MKQIYYAHFMGIYGSQQEKRDLETIDELFPDYDYDLYNPSEDINADESYKLYGMDYFLDIVEKSDILIFRGLPNGKIPSGVMKEIKHAEINNIPIIELPSMVNREMSVDDTRSYLKECGFR